MPDRDDEDAVVPHLEPGSDRRSPWMPGGIGRMNPSTMTLLREIACSSSGVRLLVHLDVELGLVVHDRDEGLLVHGRQARRCDGS